MSARRWLRRAGALAGAVSLASVARADAPPDQYGLFDMNDVTIEDAFTKLTWQRYPSPATMTFDTAAAYCQGLSLGSYASGWRVPSYKELLTLVDEKPHGEYENGKLVPKAIDGSAFGATAAGIATPTGGNLSPYYWTSSTYPGSATPSGYVVSFGDGSGHEEAKTAALYVRCVHFP